jgi:hypothetical protein
VAVSLALQLLLLLLLRLGSAGWRSAGSGVSVVSERESGAMNGHANGGGAAAARKADKGADFANYFCTYAFLYHQKEMLSDRVRMDAYYDSIFKNARHFKGKVRNSFSGFDL